MKDKKIMILGAVALLCVLALGLTYAFFSYIGIGSTENTISSDSITFLYDEVDQQGNGITLTNALPISDTEGKGQTQDFDFRIVSDTSTGISIPYEITLRKKVGSDDIDDIVKVYLAKTTDSSTTIANEEEVELSKYSDLETVTKNGHQEKLLHIDKVPGSNSTYNQGYRLKMWIDDSADYSEITVPAKCSDGSNKTEQECTSPNEWVAEHNEYPYNNKTFAVTVNVYSTGHVQTQQDIEAASRTDITSLSVNNTVLTGNNNLYEMELPNGTTETTINVETTNPYTKAVIEKTDSTYQNVISMNTGIQKLSVSKKVSLSEGDNYFRVRLTSEDTTDSSEIHLYIYVLEPISGSYVSNLEPQDGTTLQGLAKMVYDDNTLVQDELTESQLKAVDSANHTGYIYQTTRTMSGNPTYFFRGNVSNNYVNFAGKVWRIIRINEDGTVRIILENGINSNTVYPFQSRNNNPKYMYYTTLDDGATTAKTRLDDWYETNIQSSKVAYGDYYCEQAKTTYNSSWATASGTNMTPYAESGYIPDFGCETDAGHGIVRSNIALITYEEMLYTGSYVAYNNAYFLNKQYTQWWTMSPGGFSDKAYEWFSDRGGVFYNGGVEGNKILRPVINLRANVTATKEIIDGKTYYTVN